MPIAGGGIMQYAQLRRSWYMFFFQHPLADVVVAGDDLRFVDHLWEDWSPGYDAGHDLPLVKDALRDSANLGAAIGYYRAMLGDGARDPELDAIEASAMAPPPIPTLYLHGADDGCMGVELAEQAAAFLEPSGSQMQIVADAGHFLHLEQPDVVNAAVVAHLTSS
jgi:pimeloyl-ACP methyl ester carboxylesterase